MPIKNSCVEIIPGILLILEKRKLFHSVDFSLDLVLYIFLSVRNVKFPRNIGPLESNYSNISFIPNLVEPSLIHTSKHGLHGDIL